MFSFCPSFTEYKVLGEGGTGQGIQNAGKVVSVPNLISELSLVEY